MPAQQSLTPSLAENVLREAAQFVIETMFFAESEPVAVEAALDQPCEVLVEVSFGGEKNGRLAIGIPESCARIMAGSFEGMADPQSVSAGSIDHVALELANMICGATLTRLDGDGLFTLGSPRFTHQGAERGIPAVESAECWLQIPDMGEAIMHLALALEEQA